MTRSRTASATLAISAALSFLLAVHAAGQEKRETPAKKSARPATSPAPDAKKGKDVYETYCEICHDAKSEDKKVGPGLKGIYKRGKFEDGKKVDDRSMREWIVKGGKDMPSFEELTAEELRNLIAFIRTL